MHYDRAACAGREVLRPTFTDVNNGKHFDGPGWRKLSEHRKKLTGANGHTLRASVINRFIAMGAKAYNRNVCCVRDKAIESSSKDFLGVFSLWFFPLKSKKSSTQTPTDGIRANNHFPPGAARSQLAHSPWLAKCLETVRADSLALPKSIEGVDQAQLECEHEKSKHFSASIRTWFTFFMQVAAIDTPSSTSLAHTHTLVYIP